MFTVVIAVFWLSASAAWANGLNGIKGVYEGKWIEGQGSICEKEGDSLTETSVASCKVTDTGSYKGANVSVVWLNGD